MKSISQYVTGSKRGYIHVADREKESEIKPIPETLDGLRGNVLRAMRRLAEAGATHYTVAWDQGVPGKGYSNQYCYATYTGYRAEEA